VVYRSEYLVSALDSLYSFHQLSIIAELEEIYLKYQT